MRNQNRPWCASDISTCSTSRREEMNSPVSDGSTSCDHRGFDADEETTVDSQFRQTSHGTETDVD